MPSKKELDANAWEWAKNTEPNNVTENDIKHAYRLHLKPCKPGSCRRNCKGNPKCLNGIGEREWLGEIDDSKWHDIEDPEEERREKNNFVGLKNLGATCYVNSLLQVWFHNPRFRSVIYEWTDPDIGPSPLSINPSISDTTTDSDTTYSVQPCTEAGSSTALQGSTSTESAGDSVSRSTASGEISEANCSAISSEELLGASSSCSLSPRKRLPNLTNEKLDVYMPSSICGRLQLVFALLQQSNRSYVDPTPFIASLGIDAGLQQDAQEFSKLFISLLEDTLSRDPNPRVSRVIQDHFSGEYDYVTRCGKCQTCSRRSSQFYELDLNIKGHKELGECIAEFLEEEKLDGDNQYFCSQCNSKQNAIRKIQLRSLPPVLNLQLLRFVFDRNSGHKKKLNIFIQFPVVLDMSSYLGQPEQSIVYDLFAVLLHRGPSAYSGHYVAHIKDSSSGSWYKFNDEEIEKMAGRDLQLGNEDDVSDKASKKPKATKGFHCSRNSYMLVYHRRGYGMQHEAVQIPDRVMQYVRKDNEQFEDWVEEMKAMRAKNVECGKARQGLVKAIYERLPAGQEHEFDWMSSDWLLKWFQDPEKAKPIDNAKLLCSHNRLDPDKVSEVKCVSKDVADDLYKQYGGTHKLDNNSLCVECVKLRCHVIHMEARVEEDSKLISQVMKNKQNITSGFWVCKRSLRSWKKLAKREQHNGDIKQTEVDSTDVSLSQNSSNHEDTECNDDDLIFNQDLLCKHNELNTDIKSRTLVSEDIWRRLRRYFPQAPEFHTDTGICRGCQCDDLEDAQTKDLNKMVAHDQKMALQDLYHDKNRPTWTDDICTVNVISTAFLDEWRKFIKDPSKREVISDVSNAAILCPHGKLMLNPQLIGVEEVDQMITLVSTDEWQTMTKCFCCDVEILISRVVNDDGSVSFICEPEVCNSCLSARQQEEQRARLDYEQATVFVRKITEPLSKTEQQQVTPNDSDKDDPEFTQGPSAKKKKKNPTSHTTPKNLDCGEPSRRSSRHKRARGEKEVKVSSKQSLRDFKLQLMKEYGSPPMDQHLMLDNTELVGDTATLASLNILPGSIIYLKVDEPMGDGILMEDIAPANCREEGFKGTGLMGSLANL